MTDPERGESGPGVAGTRRVRRDVHGILLLDKPPGLSSNQALQRVKWLYQARKAGHTGSLDPLATGMLPVCLGEATKLSAFLLDSDKVYRVRMCLGSQTATGDAEGPVVATGPPALGRAELERALAGFRGTIAQTPPMYSALKHEGRRLYEIAREGLEVPRDSRTVRIHELLVESHGPEGPVLRVRCSKGTYIRTLVEDIAVAAGTVAHVADLRRLSVAPFEEAGMATLPVLEEAARAGHGALERFLLAPDRAVPGWPALHLGAVDATRIGHGQAIVAPSPVAAGRVRLYGPGGRFLGVGESLPDGRVTPQRLMAAPAETGL